MQAGVTADERADIMQLIGSYANFFEFRQGEAWAGLFAEDGTFQTFEMAEPIKGRSTLAAACNAVEDAPFQIHAQINTILVKVDEAHIRGLTNLLYLRRQDGVTAPVLAGYVDYHDMFTKTADGWRFQSRNAVPHLQEPLSAALLWPINRS